MTVRSSGGLRRVISDPAAAFSLATALLRGHWYRVWFRVRGRRFTAGRNLRVFGRIVLRGPGRLTIGDNVVLLGRVTPWTHHPDARITIGSNSRLDGVRFGCAESITIGPSCRLAESHILDTDFHSTRADRNTNPDAPVRTLPVVLEENVWVSGGAGLLPGTRIGRNSVVGFGAVCVRAYPENAIIFGNPAKVIAPVESAPTPARDDGALVVSIDPVNAT